MERINKPLIKDNKEIAIVTILRKSFNLNALIVNAFILKELKSKVTYNDLSEEEKSNVRVLIRKVILKNEKEENELLLRRVENELFLHLIKKDIAVKIRPYLLNKPEKALKRGNRVVVLVVVGKKTFYVDALMVDAFIYKNYSEPNTYSELTKDIQKMVKKDIKELVLQRAREEDLTTLKVEDELFLSLLTEREQKELRPMVLN